MTILRPLVAVSADYKFIDGYNWHASPEQYLKAACNGSGVIPMILPSLGTDIDIESVVAQVDGVLITGSRANVHPSHYDVEPSEAHEPFDPARDATSIPLIRAALKAGVPLLAICRGIQELNVALGGSLETEIQTLDGKMDHRMPPKETPEERFAIQHPIKIAAGSCLAKIFGAEEINVNSLHRQAISRASDRLIIEAVAEDGTIEGVSVRDSKAFAVGVQWHPEFWVLKDKPSTQIFEAFGDAVRQHQTERMA